VQVDGNIASILQDSVWHVCVHKGPSVVELPTDTEHDFRFSEHLSTHHIAGYVKKWFQLHKSYTIESDITTITNDIQVRILKWTVEAYWNILCRYSF
jgi:hypothetical protein